MNMDNYIVNGKIRIKPENFREIFKYIDDWDLSKLAQNNEINLYVLHGEDELINEKFENSNPDWAKILNSITNRGYKVNIGIAAWAGSIDESIEMLDFAKQFMQQQNKIKNKENISIGYCAGLDQNFTKYKDVEDIENILDLCVKDIEDKDFSPLEKFVAAYKVVVGMFLGSDNANSDMLSFDKYSSIDKFPNIKPMCQTYTQLFEALCKRLNIKCFNNGIDAGGHHSTDIVEIKDDKYNIDGRYFVDITLAASLVREYISMASKAGATLDDNLPMTINLIFIGNDKLEEWSKNYSSVEPEYWKFMKLSDESVSNSILLEAAEVVNKAFITNQMKK